MNRRSMLSNVAPKDDRLAHDPFRDFGSDQARMMGR